MSDKLTILRLYKELLKESSKFKSYYYRNYFTRKVKTEFRKNINANQEAANELIRKSEASLAMLKRQTLIVNSYNESKLVVE